MASRSRSGAAQAASDSSAATTIADLLVDVLARCLGFLCLEERQRAALVSKRFAAAACIPELLRQVSFEYGENLAPLQSLAAWLARHGQHVRTLALWDATADDLAANAVNASVASATRLTAACAPGRLEVLEADMKLLAHTDWLAPARSLRDLTLTGRPLHVSPAIAGLTALQSLELRGRLQYAAGFQFPTSLTRLSLAQDDLHEMPPQVAQLTRLQRLNLCTHSYSSGSLSCLSAMAGSLTRLHLSSAHGPSAGLAVLTRLQHWECRINNEAATQALAGALPHLAGLTCLIVQGRHELNPLPAALGELAHLELCYVGGPYSQAEGPPPQLPSGPWLQSLECLGVGIDILLSSAPVLQQATRLRHLGLHNASGCEVDWESPTAAAFFDWLACHPPLRCLTVDEDDVENMKAFETASFLVCIMQLWRRRPSLLAHCPGLGDDGDMLLGQLHHRNPF